MLNFLYSCYIALIYLPIGCLATILVATSVAIFGTISPNGRMAYLPAILWGRFMCYFAFMKVEIKGLENIDRKKSYIFVANHQSVFDIWLVYGWLNSTFKWILKEELRKVPFIGMACKRAGHIFVNRRNPVAANRSIKEAKRKLVDGVSVVVFPEGSRTKDGKIGKFKKGAYTLAVDLHLPLVPITLNGCYTALPKNFFKIKRTKLEMIIHEPIDTSLMNHENMQEYIDKTHSVVKSALK